MGRLDPSQQDKWWKSRIEKEELQYGLKQNGADTAKPAGKEVTFLNTLGQPQIKRAAAAEVHLNGAGAVIGGGAPPPQPPPQQQPARPQTAASQAAAGDDDARSVASAAKSTGGKAASVASLPRSVKAAGSQAGTEAQSALVRRLDVLEEALAAERVKRLQAEEEMRQLMAMSQGRKK